MPILFADLPIFVPVILGVPGWPIRPRRQICYSRVTSVLHTLEICSITTHTKLSRPVPSCPLVLDPPPFNTHVFSSQDPASPSPPHTHSPGIVYSCLRKVVAWPVRFDWPPAKAGHRTHATNDAALLITPAQGVSPRRLLRH